MSVDLIADRVVVFDDRHAFDLASGDRLWLVESSAGGASEQTRWAVRCDRFFRLRQRCIARLVDFGAYGNMRRFEAWRCDGPWCGPAVDAKSARQTAATYLTASGLTIADSGSTSLGACDGRPVLMPDAGCGYDVLGPPPEPAASLPLSSCGLALENRRAVAAVAEVFSGSSGARPRAIAIWGPPGAGVRTAVQELARAARVQGFVPIGLPMLLAADGGGGAPLLAASRAGAWIKALDGRSVCLIVDDNPVVGWRALVDWSLRCFGPHVVLFGGRAEVPGVDGLELGPMVPGSLIRSVQPECVGEVTRQRIARAAAAANGLPGRFARLLWGDVCRSANQRPSAHRSRAAEQPEVYRAETGRIESDSTIEPVDRRWPATAELAALRGRLDGAIRLLERGRYEPGSRAVRQAVGALVRRHDWTPAARGGIALARAQLGRGRPGDARTTLVDARHHLSYGAGDSIAGVEAAVLSGVASTDLGRLDESEAILHGAVALAHALGDARAVTDASLALARCLFWRGRHAEAEQALGAAANEPVDRISVRAVLVGALRSRIAVGRGDVGAAVRLATASLDSAQQQAQAFAIARAACAAAFVHLAIGDRVALDRDVGLALSAARAAADPFCALRARLLRAEYAGHSGQPKPATAFLARLAKIPASRLPLTIRARIAVLNEVIAGQSPIADIVTRQAAATGLKALTLFAPWPASDRRDVDHAVVNELLEILRCCQSAEDGRKVLGMVVAHLRRQLAALAISCVSPQGGLLTAEGPRAESSMARRVLAAGQPIVPHLYEGSIEGGAPVRYGGEPIAALVGRWAPGVPRDWSRASLVMTLAATALGPTVAEAIIHGRAITARALGDLHGASPAMDEVRRAVERAAAAPFPVLIAGESGSGKELVARALHRHGPRRDRPFCTINCAALPDDLVESELFGHARGAFTGAAAERPGVFEEAHTGTLFLDEIGELSPRAQAKVLRTIQEGELRRVGENISRRIDVRIVAATNRDLRAETTAGRFRHDLLYRLDVVRIAVPALRDRREDIALLAERFWQEASARVGSRAVLGAATVAALVRYDWPGNVRELQNVLAALAVRSPKRGVVPPSALPPLFAGSSAIETWRLDVARRTFEERFVRAALVRTAGHRVQAAEQLGVTRQGLAKLMNRLGINDQ